MRLHIAFLSCFIATRPLIAYVCDHSPLIAQGHSPLVHTNIFLTDDEPQNSLFHLHAFDLTLAAKNRHFTFLQALLLFSLLPPAKNFHENW